jgi:CBS domain-containing protein
MGLMRLVQETPQVSPDVSVLDAVRVMTEAQVGAIAVTSGRNGKQIVGIFTERDLMKRVVHQERDPRATRIAEVMTSPVETVPNSTSVAEAAAIMRDRHIRHLMVVDPDGELIGLVAQRYLLYDLMSDLEIKVENLEGYIMADGPGG